MLVFLAIGCLLYQILVHSAKIPITRQGSGRLRALGLALAALSLAVLVRQHYSEFWRADFCMDSGGRYNYEQHECEF
jgi:hypothetical protein